MLIMVLLKFLKHEGVCVVLNLIPEETSNFVHTPVSDVENENCLPEQSWDNKTFRVEFVRETYHEVVSLSYRLMRV